VSASQILVGIALTVGLAVACQIIAAQLGIPAIIVLLPVGFAAGALIPEVNPDKIFGAAFPPLAANAEVLFDDQYPKDLPNLGQIHSQVHFWPGSVQTWTGSWPNGLDNPFR
jgi:hypothetical protein